MRRAIYGILTVLSLVLVWGATADAKVILVTPAIVIDDNEGVTCVVTNFDSKPATLKVDIYSDAPLLLQTFFNECNAVPLAVGKSCYVTAFPVEFGALCRIESSSSKVVGALLIRTGGTKVAYPATRL